MLMVYVLLGGMLFGAAYAGAVAGSFGASVSSVVAGTKIVAGTFGAGGFGAGARMIMDNYSNAFSSVAHVFWTGGEVAKGKASELAKSIGGKTIEMTRLGQYLERTNASRLLWDLASANFANTANSSYAIINALSTHTTFWAVEYLYLLTRGVNLYYL